MAIVIRMVSADGKKVIMKSLPGLPARIKVPAGAKVDITENGQTKSLAQYVNEHANRADHDKILDDAKVSVETVEDWDTASAWLDTLEGQPDNQEWFSDAKDGPESTVLGLSTTALLVGGAVVGAVGYGVYELTKDKKDNTAPGAPTGLDLAADDDTGSSNTDNITNKTSELTITGKAEAGSTVELFNGTTSLGTVTVGADGNFSKDISLTAGALHDITARATDRAGNASSLSTVLRIGVDTTPAAAPAALDLAVDDDTGSSSTDNITNKTTEITIAGTAEANATVELFDGTTSLGTVTAGTNGVFSKDVALAAGVHSITARATDLAGNAGTAASAALSITVDTTAPGAPTGLDLAAADDTGTSNSDNVTSLTSGLTITGAAEAGSSVELFDGTTSLGKTTAGSTGAFTIDISLAAGTHAITARATDVAGNLGAASTALNITVDTAQPTAPLALDFKAEDDTGVSNSDNITNKTNGLSITGTSAIGSQVQIFAGTANLGTVTTDASGRFSLDVVTLGEGTYDITARALSASGTLGPVSETLNVTIDITPPAAPTNLDLAAADDNGASDSDNVTSLTSGLTISGNAEAGSRVQLFDGTTSLGTVTTGANGVFTYDINLAVGMHAITAQATDVAGNLGPGSAALNISIIAEGATASASAAALHSYAMDLDHIGLADTSSSFG